MLDELFSVTGKVALVTGGSRGIGEMIAEGLVRSGVTVYISSRKADVCERTAARLSEHGSCVAIPADLSTPDGCQGLADELTEREERLHILVNNAGATWGAPIEEYPVEGWDKVMDTNVRGVFLLTRALLPLLTAAGSHEDPARVVNVGSVEGFKTPRWENYAYPASKAAVHHLSRALAIQLGPRHVTVNALAPGAFPTDMLAFIGDEGLDEVAQATPLRRVGRLGDAAGAVLYLCSRAGAFVTGIVLPVDGGAAL